MRKFSNSLIIIFLLSNFFYCKELISVQAQYDPTTKTLIYNGNSYKISEQKEIFKDYLETEIISLNSEEKESDSFFDGFWFNFIGFSVLACFAGAMSGLTVGYLSIDMLILEIKLISGTEQEKIYANKIKKIISDHHWILVTLLLCNAFACEAMPILLDKLVNEMMAIVISVTVLLFVGEIVPQALCTGPNQMRIAAFLAPFTYALMIITYPLSFPIAKFMDCVVGLHGKTRFCNSDLKSVIELHVKEYKGNLNPQQMGYFTGFLDIMNKKVGELMLPVEKVFKLNYKYKINKANIDKLIESGYSRIPIYEEDSNNLIGILRVKDLIGKDLLRPCLLNELDIKLTEPIHITEDTLFLDLFEKFKSGKSRMAFIHKELKDEKLLPNNEDKNIINEEKIEVKEPLLGDIITEDKKEEKKIKGTPVIGIITLKDLIENWLKIHIMGEENYDEDDKLKKPKRKTTL
jgi:CBS domain containing-hemolysin-like protein